MLHHPETCEGCNKTSEENHSLLCEECQDKAAMFDITLIEKRELQKTRDNVLADLEQSIQPGNSDEIVTLLIARAIARLRVSKNMENKD